MSMQATRHSLAVVFMRWLVAFMLLVSGAQAFAQTGTRDFDHVKTGFPLTGVHTTQRCDSCHVNGVFKGTPKDCANCHTSGARLARTNLVMPARHLPTKESCDTCHNTRSFSGARFSHTAVVAGTCATCHNGTTARGKHPQHIVTQAACDTCHRTTASWSGAKPDHRTFTAATNCSSCHNGTSATGKPATHVPTTANCISCHATTAFKPSRFNHTQVTVTNQCSLCHSGAFPPASGRPVTHIPYQTLSGVAIINCDSCHKGGFVAWAPARFHSNVSVSTQCASCHTGSFPPAVRKPNTPIHANVTTCETCHRSTASWLTVVFAHSPANAVGTGTCDTCHNGSTAKGKPATHIPVTTGVAKCDSCHRSQASFATAVTMNHSGVTAMTCKTCHSGNFTTQGTTGALAKPANHIPEAQLLNGAAMDCNACHTSTALWTTLRMNHNNSLGGGAGWCKSCHASGTPYLGNMQKKALTHKTKTPPAIDCSESGCHRPLGNRGTPSSSWN